MLMPLHNKAVADISLLDYDRSWKGDFDGMVDRRVIRFLIPYSKTFYFIDGATQRGISYDGVKLFEKWLNKELGTRHLKVNAVIIPTRRDKLFSGLVKGRGDVALGNLTVTRGREKIVDFADAFATGVREIIAAAPNAPAIESLDDLSGREVFVRLSSSYHESLKRLNERFIKSRKEPVKILPADEYLEDEDLLEMINGGLIPYIVIDEHKAVAWAPVFKNVKLYTDIPVRTGGMIACALRKNSPELKKVINRFVVGHKQGALQFDKITQRYLKNIKWVKNALLKEEFQRFKDTFALFRKYAARYEFDWVMVAALAYQESGINQHVRSPAGAVGVMQILPSTAKDRNVNIPNIDQVENNIHAGIKYLRFLRDQYLENQPMSDANKTFFTFASYNAGPGRVARLRKEAVKMDLDPNEWFGNVEIVAAKRIGRETVQYVSNIYKYYTAYRLIMDKLQAKKEAKQKKRGEAP